MGMWRRTSEDVSTKFQRCGGAREDVFCASFEREEKTKSYPRK